MTVSLLLIFLRQSQICVPTHLYWNVEKSFYQNVSKTNGLNLQYVTKTVIYFSYNQNLVPWGLSALAHRLYACIELCNFKCVLIWNCWASFTRFHLGPSVDRLLLICSNDFAPLNKMAACSYMVKLAKIFSSRKENGIFVYSIAVSSSTKFVQLIIVGWLLTVLEQGQMCVSIDLYGRKVEKSYFANMY